MNKPVVSLITVSYNSKECLKKSLDMLKRQDYPFIESIIIDGDSSDGSKDIIEEFVETFAYTGNGLKRTCKWISEPDDGAYYALNKGLDMAEGDIIGCYWDMFASEHAISDIVSAILFENADGAHGDLVYIDDNDHVIRDWHEGNGTIQTGWMPGHPTLYLKRAVYDRFGRYDTSFRISADYEFMVRCFKDGQVKLAYIPEQLIKMFYGGMSSSGIWAYMESVKEVYRALKKNNMPWPIVILFRRILKTIAQFK